MCAATQSHLRPVQTKHPALTLGHCPAVPPASTQVSRWHRSEPQTAAPQPGPSDPCHCWWVGALTFAGRWRLTRRRADRMSSPEQLPLPWQGWSSQLHSCVESRHCCWCHHLQQELCRGQRLAAQGVTPKLLHFCAEHSINTSSCQRSCQRACSASQGRSQGPLLAACSSAMFM